MLGAWLVRHFLGEAMRLTSVSSFYRNAYNTNAKIEDGCFINNHAKIFGVTDGNSAAFSPSNPPLLYNGLTGAQMVNVVLTRELANIFYNNILEEFLLTANREVFSCHGEKGQNPMKGDDVGGACFAFCQPTEEGLKIILGGDCFIFLEAKQGPFFYTGFDKDAFEIEKRDQMHFNECKEKVGGDIGKAWDLYYPIYRNKRIACKNRNIGKGGDASLNGDPELDNCWKQVFIPWNDEPRLVILGTDGLLPPTEIYPRNFSTLTGKISRHYESGGIENILMWRDSIEQKKSSLTHIEGWPEASAVVLEFRTT